LKNEIFDCIRNSNNEITSQYKVKIPIDNKSEFSLNYDETDVDASESIQKKLLKSIIKEYVKINGGE
jgi:DNA-directed RNA polymerase subunit L